MKAHLTPTLWIAAALTGLIMFVVLITASTAQGQGATVTAAATVQFSGEVDVDPTCPSTDTGIVATIDWGDGTATSAGAYDANGNVTGTHTYSAANTYTGGSVTFSGDSCTGSDPLTANVAAAPLYKQCPPVYLDFGCQFVIVVSNSGTTVGQDANQGAYEGSDDSLIGIVNDSSDPISSIPLSAPGTDLFGFDEDGMCNPGGTPVPAGCVPQAGAPAGTACGPDQDGICAFPAPPGEPAGYVEPGAVSPYTQNGYEGPTTWFSNVSTDESSGQINFSPALQPGQSTYFSLEEPPTAAGLGATSPPGAATPSGSPPTVTSTGAQLTGLVNPNGSPTTAFFQYGTSTAYGSQTPSQSVGADFADHTVTATLGGLDSSTTYHYRLAASNPNGTTFGPDETFITAPPLPPVLGKSADVFLVSGTVFIKVPAGKGPHGLHGRIAGVPSKGQGFVLLTRARQVPIGSQIDALRGTLQLVAATAKKNKTQQVRLTGGVFSLSQARKGPQKGLTTFALKENAFKGAPSYASCTSGKKLARTASAGGPSAEAAKLKPKVLQTLLASEKSGKFQTKGRYSSATVRGTEWETEDRCDGTLTAVKRGVVAVQDFHTRKTIVLRAGHSFLAKP
jgi:hypothetical protein